MKNKVYTAIGMMSGTSLDGVDAALIRTDGHDYAEPLGFVSLPYEGVLRDKLRACLGRTDRDAADVREAERLMTQAHIEAVRALPGAGEADVIGFHGQTIFHNPNKKATIQIGNAGLLARETGIDVVHDFRSADVRAGGQGAPLLPLYHRALAAKLEKPLAVLNIGGVANVTWIGKGEGEILAFDTGPGNALMDDFVRERTGQDFDEDGRLAGAGKVAGEILVQLMAHPYFAQRPPKSLDRNEFNDVILKTFRSEGSCAFKQGDPSAQALQDDMSVEDGAATLAAFTVQSIIAALDHMPQKPGAWYVTGGGRKNKTIMNSLKTHLKNVAPVENIGWNGDALEAEGFAYLAVRSLLGLPLGVPGTTGVKNPTTGGVLTRCR